MAAGETPAETTGRGRLAARMLQGGTEPDPRFTLANERTFLAWIRTSLALLAGGIAVEAFTADLFAPEVRKAVALLLLVLALILGSGAFFRWLRVERAMRSGTPLPLPLLAPILAIGGGDHSRRPAGCCGPSACLMAAVQFGHSDPGLQPERTSLAWGRTSLALVVASAMFLRWLPTHGWYAVSLVFSALVLAIVINSTQRRRYGRASATIRQEAGRASTSAVFTLAAAVVALSGVGIVAVLVLPAP